MGFLFGKREDTGMGIDALASLLGISIDALQRVSVQYQSYSIAKRNGGMRTIAAPHKELKHIQRLILRKLLYKLPAHPAAKAFKKGLSVYDAASPHIGQDCVAQVDMKDFFTHTSEQRIEALFKKTGWNYQARRRLCELLCWQGGLPQGAPSSPHLSNAVNYELDVRIEAAMKQSGAAYTRYADDISISLRGNNTHINSLLNMVRRIITDYGYHLHMNKKRHVRRRHQRQIVCGLVVNEGVRLPREERRRVRAIRHQQAIGRISTNNPQTQGLLSWAHMIEKHPR